jgi:AsmA protein
MNDSVSVTSPPGPPRKWFAPLLIVAAVLIAIGATAAGAAHLLFSADVLDKDIAAQIRRTTGFSTTIEGSTRLRLFPRPRIEIEHVAFFDAAGAVRIEVATFDGYLRVLPLLVGRIEIGRAALYAPDLSIVVGRTPTVPAGAIGRFAQATNPQDADATLLGRIDIFDGHAHLQTGGALTSDIDDINMSLNWPSAYASAALSGQLTLHGQPISVEAWLSQPIELLRGGQSATTLRINSDVLTLLTSGRIAAVPRIQYTGQLSADAASLRKLAEVAGTSFPRHGTFADFDLRSDLDVETGSAALTNLHVSLDGNDYEGDFAVENENGLPRFSGTLACDLLDVTPFFTQSGPRSGADASWTHQALDLSDLRFADLDLRISASRLRLNDIEIEDAALSLMTKPGLIDLALAEASANHGTLKGRVSLTAKDQTLEFHATGTGKDIDIAPMALGLGGKRPLSGSLDASLAFDSTGADFGQLVQALAGRAEILVTNGEIKGTDLGATLQQAGQKAAGETLTPVDGATAFDRLSFGLHLVNGLAEIEQGQFSAPGVELNFAGAADVGQRRLDLLALGNATTAGSRRIQTTPLSLRLKGSFDKPDLIQGEADLHLPALPAHNTDLPDDATSYAPPE